LTGTSRHPAKEKQWGDKWNRTRKCEASGSSSKLQRKDREKRAKVGQPEGTDIPRFFDGRSENKRNIKRRKIVKREGDRETEHERRIEMGQEAARTFIGLRERRQVLVEVRWIR
jgi:hypothetical protein